MESIGNITLTTSEGTLVWGTPSFQSSNCQQKSCKIQFLMARALSKSPEDSIDKISKNLTAL